MMKSLLKIFMFVLLLLTLNIIDPMLSNADSFPSNCIINKIGSPTGTEPGCSTTSGSSGGSTPTGNSFVDAAQALKDAWVTCNGTGSTTYADTDVSCISSHLSKYNTGSTFTAAFNYPDYIFGGVDYGGCVQCLGFVRLVAILVTNQDSTSSFLINADPADIIGASGKVVSANGGTFTEEDSPEPGDIGLTADGGFGHILIVKQLKPNPVDSSLDSFIAIEANWVPCHATDDQTHLDSGFIYYRYSK
jgi:hypothetical protein